MAYQVRLLRTDDGYVAWGGTGFTTAEAAIAAGDLVDKPGVGTWHYSLQILADTGDHIVVANRSIGTEVVKGT